MFIFWNVGGEKYVEQKFYSNIILKIQKNKIIFHNQA